MKEGVEDERGWGAEYNTKFKKRSFHLTWIFGPAFYKARGTVNLYSISELSGDIGLKLLTITVE